MLHLAVISFYFHNLSLTCDLDTVENYKLIILETISQHIYFYMIRLGYTTVAGVLQNSSYILPNAPYQVVYNYDLCHY